jgi:hypothetical protein
MLMIISGEAGVGGIAQWTKGKKEWLEIGGVWTKRPTYQLTPAGATLSDEVAISFPHLRDWTTAKRDQSHGEVPWTNMDNDDSE